MTMKKKKLASVISLAVGVCLFSGAAFASYNTSNGYSVLKKSLINTLKATNYTLSSQFSLSLDDTELVYSSIDEKYTDENGGMMMQKYSERSYEYNDGAEYGYTNYQNRQMSMQIDSDGGAFIYDGVSLYNNDYFSRTLNGGIDMEDKTAQKTIRFIELLADSLIGDIKNNFVYVSGDDTSDTYELKLSTVQIPELFNAGISAMFSTINDSYENTTSSYDNPFLCLGTEPVIDSVQCTFTVDKEGKITNGVFSASLAGTNDDGKLHKATAECKINISDYGNTTVEIPDISSLNVVYRESEDPDIKFYDTEEGVAISGTGETYDIQVNENGEVNLEPEKAEVTN